MANPKIKKTKGVPDEIDKHVGQKLKTRRLLLGMSQENMAEQVGITFQQVQKYERGTNRISASRLLKFSKILDVPVNFFYEGIEESSILSKKTAMGMADNKQEAFSHNTNPDLPSDVLNKKETLDLIRHYYTITDPDMRKMVVKIIKSMASGKAEKN